MVGCYAYFFIQDHYLTVTYGVPQLGMPNYGTGNRITTCQYILMVQCKCYLLVLKTFDAVALYSLHLKQTDYLSQYFFVSEPHILISLFCYLSLKICYFHSKLSAKIILSLVFSWMPRWSLWQHSLSRVMCLGSIPRRGNNLCFIYSQNTSIHSDQIVLLRPSPLPPIILPLS